MTARELAWMWLVAGLYTGYVCAVAFLFPWLLGETLGVIAALVAGFTPIIAFSFWSLR